MLFPSPLRRFSLWTLPSARPAADASGHRWLLGLIVGAALVGAGCGSSSPPASAGAGVVCHDPMTGACVACVGAGVCVDPKGCYVIPCGAGDIAFGGGDTAGGDVVGGDASGSDGAARVGGDASDGDGAAVAEVADGAADGSVDAVDDGSALDVDISVDADADADADIDAAPPICTNGSLGCFDNKTAALCSNGVWLPAAPCPTGWSCQGKACSCALECEAIGQKSCHPGTVAAVRSCALDAGGCLHWQVPVACAPGETCSEGLCVPKSTCSPACGAGYFCQGGVCKPDPTACTPACGTGQICNSGACVGTLTCGQTMACIEQYAQGPGDTVHIDACLAKASPAALAQYKARKACIALSCQTIIDAGKVYEALLCVYSKCAVEQTTCTGVGVGDCGGLGGCLAGCGSSAVCVSACHANASVAAIQGWYGLLVCGQGACVGKVGDAWAQCVAQSCPAAYQSCFGTTGQGGLGCGGILQCAGGCGQSKDCAQQCKSQGSAAGIAALQALLACNDKQCGAVCASGSAAQCDNCLAVLCGKELAACQ